MNSNSIKPQSSIVISFFLLAIQIFTLVPTANASSPLRDSRQLWEAKTEDVLKLPSARVILADYPLIRKDFPEVARLTDQQINEWLIRNTAFMSKEQVAQQVVNSEIHVTGETRQAYRPREYGRAHVFRVDTGGLIDAKGSGGRDPHAGFERTGLATLPEVIREFLVEKLVAKIFKHIGKYDTVPCYAVLDLGFIARASGSTGQDVRAGMVLRRAHVRHHEGKIGSRQREDPVVLPNEMQLEIELELRKYGLTSTIDLHPGQYHVTQYGDQLNIQGDAQGAVVDFAGFRVKSRFDRPIFYTYDKNGDAAVSDADIAMRPGDARFIEPDPRLSVPFDLWGNTVRGNMQDNPFVWSEELAAGLEHGWAQPKDAVNHAHNLLDPVSAKLSAHSRCELNFAP